MHRSSGFTRVCFYRASGYTRDVFCENIGSSDGTTSSVLSWLDLHFQWNPAFGLGVQEKVVILQGCKDKIRKEKKTHTQKGDILAHHCQHSCVYKSPVLFKFYGGVIVCAT